MHYLDVHMMFLVVPTVFALRYAFDGASKEWRRNGVQALALMALLATIWTTPWDNMMLYQGVWDYPPEAVLATILYVPIEEHLFFVMQPLLTGAMVVWVMRHHVDGPDPGEEIPKSIALRFTGLAIGAILFVAGYLLIDRPGGYYLGSTLLWFSPVLMLQWWAGFDRLAARWRALGAVLLVSTLYLCLVDGIAMRAKVWEISDAHTLGLEIGNVPLEEIVFFFVTNVLVVSGVALYIDLKRGWRWYD